MLDVGAKALDSIRGVVGALETALGHGGVGFAEGEVGEESDGGGV